VYSKLALALVTQPTSNTKNTTKYVKHSEQLHRAQKKKKTKATNKMSLADIQNKDMDLQRTDNLLSSQTHYILFIIYIVYL
jgi:hypothetical protein